MKNQNIFPIILSVLSVIAFAGIGAAQSRQETQALVQEEAAINWEDSRARVTEYQSLKFNEDKMVVTRRAVFKDKRENIQTAIIPLARIDVSRLQSYEANNPEGMYFLSIFTGDNKNVIKVTTFFGKDTEDSIVDTYYYTLHSKNRDRNQALKEKIEHLVYLSGQGK